MIMIEKHKINFTCMYTNIFHTLARDGIAVLILTIVVYFQMMLASALRELPALIFRNWVHFKQIYV